jgi:hypothetical protein
MGKQFDRGNGLMPAFLLLAQFGKGSGDPFRSPDVIWGTAGLALALLAGALLVYFADRWRKKTANQVADSSRELTEFRRMYQRGEITEEEYAKLRDRVAQRVKAPPPAPASVSLPMSQPVLTPKETWKCPQDGTENPLTESRCLVCLFPNLRGAGPIASTSTPGPELPTPPPDDGKPANPPSPA